MYGAQPGGSNSLIYCVINIFVNFQMESLIKEMQDPDHGVRVKSQKLFLSIIPSAFTGK